MEIQQCTTKTSVSPIKLFGEPSKQRKLLQIYLLIFFLGDGSIGRGWGLSLSQIKEMLQLYI